MEEEFKIHFEGPRTDGHKLPADALIQALQNLQRAILLVAKHEHGDEMGHRARFSRDLTDNNQLICGVPEDGGYTIPATIGRNDQIAFDGIIAQTVGKKFEDVLVAIEKNSAEEMKALIPDSAFRLPILRAIKSATPAKRSGLFWSVEKNDSKLLNGETVSEHLDQLIKMATPIQLGDTPAYLTGTLSEMKFDDRRFGLKLLSGKVIQASYEDEDEPILVGNIRGIIHVHGNVSFHINGDPVSVSGVDEIIEMDEQNIELNKGCFVNRSISFNPPLVVEVSFDQDSGMYTGESEFGITLCAFTRSELSDELDETVEMLLGEFAFEEDSVLSPKALLLKSELIKRIGLG
jgi:hypothetical protein